jgi:hypothetical protein
VGQVVWLIQAADSKEQQNEYFKWTKFDFLPSTDFKLLRQMKGSSVSHCDFL